MYHQHISQTKKNNKLKKHFLQLKIGGSSSQTCSLFLSPYEPHNTWGYKSPKLPPSLPSFLPHLQLPFWPLWNASSAPKSVNEGSQFLLYYNKQGDDCKHHILFTLHNSCNRLKARSWEVKDRYFFNLRQN